MARVAAGTYGAAAFGAVRHQQAADGGGTGDRPRPGRRLMIRGTGTRRRKGLDRAAKSLQRDQVVQPKRIVGLLQQCSGVVSIDAARRQRRRRACVRGGVAGAFPQAARDILAHPCGLHSQHARNALQAPLRRAPPPAPAARRARAARPRRAAAVLAG